MNKDSPEILGKEILEYCELYSIPLEFFLEILNDQKVVPMIRGKATEYAGFLILKKFLSKKEWAIQKLNLNPQQGIGDEDISLTHKRTGLILKVECKNAVRGSMASGKNSRIHKVPHCKIKCHRSRSNIKLAGTSNDKYSVDCFDLILTNLSNAIIQGATIGEELELLYDKNTIEIVKSFYNVSTEKELLRAASNDWRFVFPKDIEENGFIPRTPYLLLENNPHWQPIDEIEKSLIDLIKYKISKEKRH